MKKAIWIIAVCEALRLLQNTLSLYWQAESCHQIAKERKADRDLLYKLIKEA